MASLFEGQCKGRAVNIEVGYDKNGKARVRWEMEVTEGPHQGKRASYSGKLDEENIKFTKRDMIAIGWKGKTTRTLIEDTKAANLAVPFSAEIATNTYADSGKTSTASKPLAALDSDKQTEIDKWFEAAGDVGGTDDALPFATADMAHEPSPIARVFGRNV
jgi:hypothetical protein